MQNDYISDEVYQKISNLAYQKNVSAGAPLTEEGDYAQWKVIEPEGAKLLKCRVSIPSSSTTIRRIRLSSVTAERSQMGVGLGERLITKQTCSMF